MSRLFDRVVLPIASEDDARTTAMAALPHLVEADATALLVNVIEKAGGAPDKASVEQREEVAQEAFAAATAVLEDAGFTAVETEVVYGTDVTDAIFDAADAFDATAIVFTPRGGSRWIRLLTGDVGLSLITQTDRPVVVLPGGEDESDSGAESVDAQPDETDDVRNGDT